MEEGWKGGGAESAQITTKAVAKVISAGEFSPV
jgi:hypothetical protein